jgi:hypothetical protein
MPTGQQPLAKQKPNPTPFFPRLHPLDGKSEFHEVIAGLPPFGPALPGATVKRMF